jgi:heterodisulfide reductase subunit B2
MKYLYYPGCSLEGTAREYNLSTRALMREMDIELVEPDRWTCCGASAAVSINELLSLVLPARNLALAGKTGGASDLLVPCSACYLNLKRAAETLQQDPPGARQINEILAETGLSVKGTVRVRHLLDVLVNDLPIDALREGVRRPLTGLRIAPYYGCQCLRPYPVFDDPEAPRTMTPLIEAVGADVHAWAMGARCCGASQMSTHPEAALEKVAAILEKARGADAIATVCPMCQMNLEAYQEKISKRRDIPLRITVLYLPQLLGLALGIAEKDLGLHLNLAVTPRFREKLGSLRTNAPHPRREPHRCEVRA